MGERWAAPARESAVGGIMSRISDRGATLRAWLKSNRRRIAVVTVLAIVALAFAGLARIAEGVDRAQVLRAVEATPDWRLAAALGATGLSFLALTFYDWTGFAAMGAPRPWRKVAPGAAAAFAVAQTAGLGPLTGAAVRWRFYAPMGVSAGEILRLVAFCTLSFGMGLALTAGAAVLWSPAPAAAMLGVASSTATLGAMAILAATLLALATCGRWGARLAGPAGSAGSSPEGAEGAPAEEAVLPAARFRLAMLRQLGVTVAEAVAAALVLWVLLPAGSIDFAGFLPLYALALALGVMSHAPAGIGVFEIVILAGLSRSTNPADAAAALVLYRLVYHVLPLAAALVAMAVGEARRLARLAPVAAALRLAAEAAPRPLAVAAMALGLVSIFARAPSAEASAAFAIAGLSGALLVASAQGLARGLDLSWRLAAAASLAAGLALTLAGAAPILALAHVALAAVLALFRARFHRPTRLRLPSLATRRARGLASGLAMVAVGALAWRLSSVEAQAAQALLAAAQAHQGLGVGPRAGVAAAFALLGFLPALRLPRDDAPDVQALERAAEIVAAQPVAAARLALSGDKRLHFSADGEAFVMYARRGSAWLALHDPVGPEHLWPELIWSFIESARAAGATPAFYQVGPERLSLYAEAGLSFWKMGEQARVDLEAFTLEGSRRQSHRRVVNLGKRDGLALEILSPEAAALEIERLAEVSDAWLAARSAREKGFSLGAFSPDWVIGGRVAVVRRAGEIVAFVTLMETAQGQEAAIDLMRHVDDVPTKCMEYLFLRLCEELKAEGVAWLDLAMAPLSGLTPRAGAPAWQKLAHALYEHGTKTYSFTGLRRFKEGLKPEWRPRYLAAPPGAAPARALLAANRLINRPEAPGAAP
ncbi:bifunctional lysylphosphatidylglycerol flippase/synthetase MprF [uncultured Albimonas sp.]|uniref:bifunctional lysylphosphatidylglycerol flippase/synthetase MprF n=1 Tax=uncultured Albimonas sp. TaxID=1331701 RepID=UPI0030EE7D62